MILPITLTIAGAAALINIWLGLRVSLLRRRHGVSLGGGGNDRIICRMRAHANFAEYAPLALILIGLVELAQGSSEWLWAAGILFILARLVHPFGMDRPGANALRVAGISITWLVLLGLAVWAIVTAYAGLDRPTAITYAEAPRANT